MTKKIIALSVATSVTLFAQSELEEVKALLAQQIKITQALQKRVARLEAEQKHLARQRRNTHAVSTRCSNSKKKL